MNTPSSLSSSELITLLEKEMLSDIRQIDVSSENENLIDYKIVNTWYLETEKLIRVIGNLLTVPLSQAINQLRYAGHHLLKAIIDENNQVKQQNLIEAYKHCKRAYYDALDFYVYKLSEDYRVLLPYLDKNSSSKLEQSLNEHLKKIQTSRLESNHRIQYYYQVQTDIISGLKLIESLNEIMRDSHITQSILSEKMELVKQKIMLEDNNKTLNNHLDTLKAQVKIIDKNAENKGYNIALWIAFILAAGTVIGLNVGAFITSKHSVTISNKMSGEFEVKSNPNTEVKSNPNTEVKSNPNTEVKSNPNIK